MRKPEYLSPTSIGLFYENLEEFYRNYLADNKPPRLPQTQPMSVGSAFDAYVKSHLHERLHGKGTDPRFELKTLFEAQVEPHNRDWAWQAGAYAFVEYKRIGALSDLMLELQGSISAPKFELEVKGIVNGQKAGVTRSIGEIPLLGKPDVFFMNKDGAHVILDWKVNGFCSKYNTSPMQGYVRLRDNNGSNKGQHKAAQLLPYRGIMINAAGALEDYNVQWARQLAIYAWLCGQDIGGDFIVAVDQLICKPSGMPDMPDLRVAAHRLKLRPEYQWKVFADAQFVWEVINSDHIFRDLSLEDSKQKCAALDDQATGLAGKGSDEDRWFAELTRS
jgi:hypothetical protein